MKNKINLKILEVVNKWTLRPFQQKIIKELYSVIMNSNLKKNYNYEYHTQIYDLKFVLQNILYVLYNSHSWRSLGSIWNNIYKQYIKINKYKLFEKTYTQMLNKYLEKTKYKNCKIVSVDTTFIYNKNGIDCIARNKFAKNKNCTKLFKLVDNKNVPLFTSFEKGTVNDSKILNDNINKIIDKFGKYIKYFLADSGFCSSYVRTKIENNNIIPLITLNIRNGKKDKKTKDMTFEEKINLQFTNFSNKERKIYKKRIGVENYFANIKKYKQFNSRYTRFIENLKGLMYIFDLGQILKKF